MTAACNGHGSLSFRYLPMAAQSSASVHHAASPSLLDSFEFSPDAGRDLCFADDVFFDGKLMPFGLPPPPSARAPAKSSVPADHRRSASSDTNRQLRQGLSAKSRDLRRASSDSSNAPKAPTTTTGGVARPVKWHLLALGGARVPATMEMSDIRSRQRRRRAANGSGQWRGEGKEEGPWRVLRSISCNAAGSPALAVAPPACFAPHVRGCAA